MPVIDYESALAFLLGRVNYETFRQMPYGEMRQNLGQLKAFLEYLGRPDLRFPVIHVAGTKGKGSTCAMLAAVFREAGYRVGCFTSPHLHTLNERFAVNGVPCPNDRLVEIVQYLELQWHVWSGGHSAVETAVGNAVSVANGVTGKNVCTQRELTFFEYSVLVAFEWFAREQVDLAVMETGMGGRFDATNICEPILCVITGISFDHTEQLGNTLSAIAGEKAGIIKPGVPVVSGVVMQKDDDPQAVIRDVAARNHAELYELNREFSIVPHDHGAFDFHWHASNAGTLNRLTLKLLGRHQRDNTALALAGVMLLRQRGWNVPDQAVRKALAELEVPCRIERFRLPNGPAVILDGAHNKASAEALLEALQTFPDMPVGQKILLFGSTLGKDVTGMFETLLPFFDEIWLSQCTTSPRTVPVDTLLELARKTSCKPQNLVVVATPNEAVEHLHQIADKGGLVCVTGSLYFAAEIRELLIHPNLCGR
ncbi:MAG: bifunctional folylpolyglutamate synthase/dihydrofolate synthase [Planctomycetaceae bacterium]|nr:bifunctional folylpolyglutamate synthase/dihydrofolate synthase [Planctomycetaceae bacterium]